MARSSDCKTVEQLVQLRRRRAKVSHARNVARAQRENILHLHTAYRTQWGLPPAQGPENAG